MKSGLLFLSALLSFIGICILYAAVVPDTAFNHEWLYIGSDRNMGILGAILLVTGIVAIVSIIRTKRH